MTRRPSTRRRPAGGNHVSDDLDILVLPHVHRLPPDNGQGGVRATVALRSCRQLGGPPLGVRLRRDEVNGAGVPEATVDEHRQPCPHEHNVGASGKVTAMQPIADASVVQGRPQGDLGLRVPGLLPRHEPAHRLGGRSGTTTRLTHGRED